VAKKGCDLSIVMGETALFLLQKNQTPADLIVAKKELTKCLDMGDKRLTAYNDNTVLERVPKKISCAGGRDGRD
jgi:hypothetical protein